MQCPHCGKEIDELYRQVYPLLAAACPGSPISDVTYNMERAGYLVKGSFKANGEARTFSALFDREWKLMAFEQRK